MNRTISLLACAVLLAALPGCTSMTPAADAHFGIAMTSLKLLQTADPEAAGRALQLGAQDSKSAKGAYDNYVKSYSDPVKDSNALSIGVGK
ncbi:MAG: hypothetical protein V4463_18070 [Pseudomonadota bacterium]